MKTVDDWLNAENFLYSTSPVLFIIGAIFLFILFFMLLYVKKAAVKHKLLIMACLIVGLAFIIVSVRNGEQKYGWYRKEISNVSSAIRDRDKKMFVGYNYSGKTRAKVSDKSKIEALKMYEQAPLVEKEGLEYLGETEYLYYFKIYRKIYKINKNSDFLVFDSTIKTPQFVGFSYKLKDPNFESIGFYQEIAPLYTSLTIPKEDEGKVYEHTSGKTEEYNY